MTTPFRRALRALLPPLAAVALVLPSDPAFASSTQAPVSERQVTVMTRNLYLGADLTRILEASNPFAGMVGVVATVEQSQPAQRMAEVAQEVAAAQPDVVALQEVATWHIGGINPLTGTRVLPAADYDFLSLLQQSLAAAGADYRVVVAQTNFDSAQQLPAAVGALATFADRDVILARAGDPVSQLQVLGTGFGHYTAQLTIPVQTLGISIDFDRGYVWADLKTRGKVWRLVDTHPEAYSPGSLGFSGPDVNGLEAAELVQALAGVTTPTVVAGDLNSRPGDPERAGYATLLGAGFADSWVALGQPATAYTCCRNETLTGGTLTERIDHVLTRGLVTPVSATRVGVDAESATPPLWPADHAGVVTTLAVGKQ